MKNCPECGAPSPVNGTWDVPYTYKGQTTVIQDISGYKCANCGEVTLAPHDVDRFSALAGDFQRVVNSELVEPEFILRVRRKLHLDQRQAGRIFGGGDNAFSRYENGKTRPHVSTVRLLKLLDRHPDLLNEILEEII